MELKNCFHWRENLGFNEIEIADNMINEFLKQFLDNGKIFQSEILQKILGNIKNPQEILSKIKNIQNSLSFNDKLLLSLFVGKKSDLKSNLLQFITEVFFKENKYKLYYCNIFLFKELSSIFEFSIDFYKFHEFIKIASWNKAFSIISLHSINLINTLCSIASFYSVNFEVFENEEVSLENSTFGKSLENQQIFSEFVSSSKILKVITEATLLGNWVMLIFYDFPIYLWNVIDKLLDNMRNENKITNSFRLIIDLQNTKRNTIPIHFLSDQTIIYYIHEDNLDEMEGFNDVWANILNDKILPTEINLTLKDTINENFQISMLSESKLFTLNNELSEISLGLKNIETEQGSILETIKSFKPN